MPEARPAGAFRSAVITAAALNLAYGLVEMGVALRIGSVSLFADSIDFFEDGAVNILIAFALGWSATSRARVGTFELGEALQDECFRADIQRVRGVGRKTVDYMACLVGVDCIAVDRHIRGFAQFAGLEDGSYEYLRDVFGFAADLLSISRREFGARARPVIDESIVM